jgi:hypothetical protein
MAEVEIVTGVRANTIGLVERFLEIATTDPIAALMLLTGTVLVAVSMAVFGVLSVGGVLSWLTDAEPTPGGPSRRAR